MKGFLLSKKIIDFLLFSSFFSAFCAISMVLQTYYLFDKASSTNYIYFVFFGALCSYNFHWYLTPEIYGGSYKTHWSVKHKNLHLFLFFIGLFGAVFYGIQLLVNWQWLLITAFITFLYSAPRIPFPLFEHLKKIAVGKTIFLSLVWTHSTVILPLVISHSEWQAANFIFIGNRFFLIYAICILFDFRDREEDKKEGVKSLITYLPEYWVNRLFWISISIFSITTAGLAFLNFSVTNCLSLLIPGVIVGLLFNYSKQSPSDYLYYFVLDGLMMFSALFVFIMRF